MKVIAETKRKYKFMVDGECYRCEKKLKMIELTEAYIDREWVKVCRECFITTLD